MAKQELRVALTFFLDDSSGTSVSELKNRLDEALVATFPAVDVHTRWVAPGAAVLNPLPTPRKADHTQTEDRLRRKLDRRI